MTASASSRAFGQATTSAPAASTAEVFRFLIEGARGGRRGLLATITGFTAPGVRAIGTHMAVLDNGDSAGSFSSGCVEAAVITEALDVLDQRRARSVRFGEGSPYLDIRLPCGGGMDVFFSPDPPVPVLERALARHSARRSITLGVHPAGAVSVSSGNLQKGACWRDGVFMVGHPPSLRLVLLGHGAEMLAMLRLARSFGASVELYSPAEQVIEAGLAEGVPSVRLASANSPLALEGDPWTAYLFLFHDHDWEPFLIAQALATSSFWVGAMGSSRTQEARRAALVARGLPEEVIARVRGPVGLIPSARDPATLALSALAEIAAAYRAVAW